MFLLVSGFNAFKTNSEQLFGSDIRRGQNPHEKVDVQNSQLFQGFWFKEHQLFVSRLILMGKLLAWSSSNQISWPCQIWLTNELWKRMTLCTKKKGWHWISTNTVHNWKIYKATFIRPSIPQCNIRFFAFSTKRHCSLRLDSFLVLRP